MAAVDPTATIAKLSEFDIYSSAYATYDSHDVSVDILVPKMLVPGKHPVIVRFHGGFLITGSSLFPGFFPAWIMDFAMSHSAILICPNYLKLPESSGVDIMKNLADFWHWYYSRLSAVLATVTRNGHQINQSQTLVLGHSAGGYLAIQSAITQPAGSIRAVIAAQPMLDMKSPFFAQAFDKHPFGRSMLSSTLVDDHIARMSPGKVVSAVNPPARLDVAIAAVQYGKYPALLGKEPILYPIEAMQSTKEFPPLFIFHGRNDRAVAVQGTEKFVGLLKQKFSKETMIAKLEDGDHGFDYATDLGEPWLKEGLAFVASRWLE